jgi:hypothetical protein
VAPPRNKAWQRHIPVGLEKELWRRDRHFDSYLGVFAWISAT